MNSPNAEGPIPSTQPPPANPDRFIVVGASGFIGRHLLRILDTSGFPTLGTRSRSRSAHRSPVPPPNLLPFDLDSDRFTPATAPAFLDQPGPLQAVILAAVDNMDWCLRERETSRRIYVDGIRRLADDLASLGARITFVSTCYVFDGTRGHYAEQDPVAPVNEYALQKLAVETHLARNIPSAWTIRLDKIIGDDPTEESLFTQWLRLLQNRQPITCIADSILSPTFVDDVAQAIVLGARHRLQGLHHVASPECFLRADLARRFCETLGNPAHPVIEKPLHAFAFLDGRALKSSLDGSRFTTATGFRHTPMRDLLARFRDRALPPQGNPK